MSISLGDLFLVCFFKNNFKGRHRLEFNEEFENQLAESGMQVVEYSGGGKKTRQEVKLSLPERCKETLIKCIN